jgi:hypothetical protein
MMARLGSRMKALVLAGFAAAIGAGFTWGLPGPDTWAVDSISPRSCGLGAIVETYWPGHWHHYPPLHMAILTVVSLPWMSLALHRAGAGLDALSTELLKPFYMTGIEVGSRLVTAVMALAIVANTMRLWQRIGGRTVGIAAGVVVASNATLVYYAHTGNLEVPYLFWLTWGLVELDRVAGGEPRERQTLLLAVASVLTKDQAAAAWILPLPVVLVVVPRVAGGKDALRPRLVGAVLLAVGVYAVVSGAATNPFGFARRVRIDLLHAGASWAAYPPDLGGRLALARDAILSTPRFTSWPIALAAGVGLAAAFLAVGVQGSHGLPGIAVTQGRGVERARALLPLLAALSFTIFFNFGARRSDERFLLPQSVFFFPYAALAFETAMRRWPRSRSLVLAVAASALAPALLGVASMDATLLADARYEAERVLAALPAGTHIEVYGSAIFLPRIPPQLVAVRPGVEPFATRQPISGIRDIIDPAMDPRPRAPEVIVLATAFSRVSATLPQGSAPFGVTQYIDDRSTALFRGLHDGSLGYTLARRAACSLPRPLACRNIHDATAGEVWIYERSE